MLRIEPLGIPETFPHPDAIKSMRDNKHGYEPEFWEFQYEIYRYLGRVEANELAARYRSIVRNMRALISPDRHVIPIQSFLSSWYWYRKEHQTRFEFALRGVDLPCTPPAGVLDNTPVDAPIRPKYPNYADVLFRYARDQYNRDLVERGRLRVAPAHYYRKLEGDEARQDEEMEKHEFLPGEYTSVITEDGKPIKVIGDIRRSVSRKSYYFLCTSCDWDQALFDDFGADSCVVIRDPQRFADRLEAAAQSHLPGWRFHHCPVEYFDPHERLPNQRIDAGMSKDFRFAYQREYRFIWVSPAGHSATDFKYLDAGTLGDIVELCMPQRPARPQSASDRS